MKRIYLAWWDNGQSYSDWSATAKIVTSDLGPKELRSLLLREAEDDAIKYYAENPGEQLEEMTAKEYVTDSGYYHFINGERPAKYAGWDVVLTEYIFNDEGNLVESKPRP